jgi:hypothetical protein
MMFPTHVRNEARDKIMSPLDKIVDMNKKLDSYNSKKLYIFEHIY